MINKKNTNPKNSFINKKIMILGAGEIQVPLIKEAGKLGCKVYVIDKNSKAPGIKFCNKFFKVSTNDKKEILKIAKKIAIDGIVTNSDYPVRTVAYISKKLNLNGPSENLAEITTNKYMQRNLLKKKKIPVPKFFRGRGRNKLSFLFNKKLFPLIVKPTDSSGSRGISLAKNFKEYKIAIENALQHSNNNEIIVEEFLIGREFSVEVLIQNKKINIISVTEKKVVDTKGKSFVEERHIIPAKVTRAELSSIINLTKKAIAALQANTCAAHVEILLNKNGPYIIEIASRLGGDYITSDLVPLSSGINMLENIIRLSLGIQIDILKTKSQYAGIQFIYSDNYDLVSMHLEKIINNDNLIRVVKGKNKSKEIVKSSLDRMGYYICKGNNRKDLSKILEYN